MLPVSSEVPELLRVDGVSKMFYGAGRDKKQVLDNLSLSVAAGATVAIVGSNGAGKSTLLNLVAGTLFPDSGSVSVAGRNITTQPSWKRLSRVRRVRQNPQDNMISSLTVEENFALAVAGTAQRFGFGRAKNRRVRELASERIAELGMGLEDRVTARSDSLSGGQRQAIALALATVGSPQVILLDEHTAALDPISAGRIREVTSRIVRSSGASALMVTHDMAHALEFSDRLLLLHAGRIVLDLSREKMDTLSVQEIQSQFAEHAGEALPDETVLGAS